MDPIKCFSCGKIMKSPNVPDGGMVAVRNMTKEDREEFFKLHKVKRLCCKRMYLSAVNFNDILLMYEGARSTLNFDGTISKNEMCD
jgi:DNA-directed RNA polymerase subunit N (RpoN/RPB10)